jgi:hypothetical protein
VTAPLDDDFHLREVVPVKNKWTVGWGLIRPLSRVTEGLISVDTSRRAFLQELRYRLQRSGKPL